MRRRIALRAAGLAVSVIPPLIAVASYFPLWSERGAGAVLSGFAVLLALMCAVPVFKLLKRILSSPSAWLMWLITFILFALLAAIADEMVVISFVGTVSGIAGALLFRMAKRGEGEDESV